MPITRKDDPWVSLVKAGRIIGIHRQTVLRLVTEGLLVSERVAGRTVIDRKSVEREMRRREKTAGAAV